MFKQVAPRLGLVALAAAIMSLPVTHAHADEDHRIQRAAAPEGAIEHVLVINLENENFADTFGAASPARYLNGELLRQGQLVVNYFGTSHVSLGNYTSQVSGQGTNIDLNNDCLNLATLRSPPVLGGFTDMFPGTDSLDQVAYPGQVIGRGCVFPAPKPGQRGAQTIGDQLDAAFGHDDEDQGEHEGHKRLLWRSYAEDMGDDLHRDWGTPDALGIGADCAHPPINGGDFSNSAAANDQYATRHNPFVYFHSVIDDQQRCNSHVVPLGKLVVGTNGAADAFSGHLYEDLRHIGTTPKFLFVTPNLCNDGHDATCVGKNVEGTLNAAGKNAGGLVSMDLWLKHWMPMILASPAYQGGKLLVVVTFDEANPTGAAADSRACEKASQAECLAPTGPNMLNQGFSPVLGLFGAQHDPGTTPYLYAGGGQVGAVLFNKRLIKAGSVNTSGSYNHYSALRSYEDLLGLTRGADDGLGHLGYAGTASLKPFGRDVFNAHADRD